MQWSFKKTLEEEVENVDNLQEPSIVLELEEGKV
jgi:hypothetical protein